MTLAGVYVYSPRKAGQDAGTIACYPATEIGYVNGPPAGPCATMGVVVESPGALSQPAAGLQECLGSLLRSFERTVGFADGVVMSFDPDVLLPNAFAASAEPCMDDALVACRNEQLDRDFLKFRDLAASRVPVAAGSRDSDPWARSSPRWQEILDVRGHRHELRAALVDASGQCWGALNFMRDAGQPFTERELRLVHGEVRRGAAAIARAMVAGGTPAGNGMEPGSVWLDDAGAVVLASPAARQWLDLLDAQAYAGFARALLAGLAMRIARDAGQDCAVRVKTADRRWVRARAERITSAAGRPQGVVVVIDAARAGSVLPLAARAYRLTGRELEVVHGVLNGLDTRSVAASLHIAEYTVQDHLKSVFDKVGVRSRRELGHEFAVHLS